MTPNYIRSLLLVSLIVPVALGATPANTDPKVILDPASWPAEVRRSVEQQQARSWTPPAARINRTNSGIVVATVSPIAVEAGRRALDAGGTAADAAATVALTQVATELGSVVSYAGIVTALYYDASTGRVSALDAGYMSYAEEKDPLSIPRADLGSLQPGTTPEKTAAHGRKTLVPGFMAGIEALHKKYGRLAFDELFAPAIWYAENGVTVSPLLAGYFSMRASAFNRTGEGRAFLAQSGRELPEAGDLFRQPLLAQTLRTIARQGAKEMYQGDWAKEFVAVVRREGGRVSDTDLAGYTPVWTDAQTTSAFGCTVHLTPLPNIGAYPLVLGLNLAEETNFSAKGPLWRDAAAWATFSRITAITTTAPLLSENIATRLRDGGCATGLGHQLTKDFARKLAPLLPSLAIPTTIDQPRHSNAVVVIDSAGNICVLTHTINAVVWGGSGLVVGGIPLPDSAGFQQKRIAHIAPGGRVPHEIIDTIVLRDGRPVLATASIGSSLSAETLRILISILAQKQSLDDVLAAPTQLSLFGLVPLDGTAATVPVLVPEGAHPKAFLEEARAYGIQATPVPPATADSLRGTIATIVLDPATGERIAVERPNIMVFSAAQKPDASSKP